jgi:ERCC4-type nuclease
MIIDELPHINKEKAAELLATFGSVKKAIENADK